MKIEATVKTEKVYNFTINGESFDGFKLESEWEGFKKLSNGRDVIISDFAQMSVFEFLLSEHAEIDMGSGNFVKIIKASPDIIAALESAKKNLTPPVPASGDK